MVENRALPTTAAALALAVLLASSLVSAREKVDVVVLKNGDRITCEIRELTLGKMTVKTDAMGTVSIEWDHVAKVETDQLFEVVDEEGDKHYGFITPADEDGRFLVLSPAGPVAALAHDRIVRIESIEESWRDRWRGFVDVGFTYTSAANDASFSLGSQATYRAKKFKWESDLTSVVSVREQVERTAWTTLNTSYHRYLRDRWYWVAFLGGESNEELQLDLRATAGGGIGRHLVQTNRTLFGLVGGLSANRENYANVEDSNWNLEAVLGVSYEYFVFGARDTKLSSSLNLLPSLTDWGRYRAELDLSLRWEIGADFTVNLGLFDTFDSDPPSEDAEKNDVRIQTTLGWTF